MQVYSGSDLNKKDIQIQTSFQKLFIIITAGAGLITKATLQAATIALAKAGRGGTDQMLPHTPVFTLAEIAAHREGLYVLNAAGTKFMATIDVGDGAAVELTNDRYISLDFSSFPGTWTTKIFTVDSPELTNQFKKIVPYSINNQLSTTVDLRGVDGVCIPKASITKLQLNYLTNGNQPRSVQYLPEELQAIMMDTNEIVRADDETTAANLTIVSEDFYIFDTSACVSAFVEFIAAQTTIFYLIKRETF
ncbi:MAG: hypothetical protein V4613_03635 [Bacteroidota bacterium]